MSEHTYQLWQLPPFEPDEPAFYVMLDPQTELYVAAIFEADDKSGWMLRGIPTLKRALEKLWERIEQHGYMPAVNRWHERHKAGTAVLGSFACRN